MNLKKINPARSMTWNNKSLTICSRQELIQCIFHLARQAAIAEQQLVVLRAGTVEEAQVTEKQKATIRAMAYNETNKRKNVESVPTKTP